MANPESGYNQPRVIPLTGGLDLQAARFFVTPGTLKECLNYETNGISGYSVVDGIEVYDGTIPNFLRDWVIAEKDTGAGTFTKGENLKVGNNIFGKCVAWDSPLLHYLITDVRYAPRVGDTITGAQSAATLITTTSGIRRASLKYADMEDFLEERDTLYASTLADKQSVFPYVSYSQNVIPHGGHWFNGKEYIIVDHYKVSFNSGGTTEILVRDRLTFADGNTGIVLDIKLDSGGWGNGDAAGSMLVKFTDDTKLNTTTTGNADLVRPNGASATTTTSNVLTVTSVQDTGSWGAGIYFGNYDDNQITSDQTAYRVANRRWFPMAMGYEANFRTDNTTTGTGIPTVSRTTTATEIYADAVPIVATPSSETIQALGGYAAATPFGPNSSLTGAATLHAALNDSNDATYASYAAPAASHVGTSGFAAVNGFSISTIPEGSVITGIQVTTRLEASGICPVGQSVSAIISLTGTKLNLLGTSTVKTATHNQGLIWQDFILGGDSGTSTDLWGFDGVNAAALREALQDSTFGVKIQLQDGIGPAVPGVGINMARLYVTVYYRVPVEKIYAYDPVTGQDISVEVPYYFLEKGEFNPGAITANNGQGSLALFNLTSLDVDAGIPGSVATTSWTIRTGWQLRTARAGGGSLLAIFSSDLRSPLLPTRAQMAAAKKQFVIITSNFYAKKDYNAFYGVSGLGQAFQWDGLYFYKFRTELDQSEDAPSHIAEHRNHLCLGYDAGVVIVSLPGEPTNFNSVLGSTEYAVSNRITNLLSVNGTGLAIFCESSIHVLTGDVITAVDENNAVMQTISPYSGALDYTAVDCGTPMFCDFRGVSTIETTNRYGDFDTGRISYKITPLIQSRVNDRYAFQSALQNVKFAKAIKNKNQYRLYCEDGLIITCSLPSQEKGYEFTTQKYVNSANSDCLVPVFINTGVTKEGVDVIFGTFTVLPNDTTNIVTPEEPERETFVYSIDRGTKFGDAPIKHYAVINFMSLENPIDFDLLRNVRLECLTYNYFKGYVRVAGDYEPFNASKTIIQIDADGKPIRIVRDSSYIVAKFNGRGTTLALEIGGEDSFSAHTLQALCLEYFPGRTQQGAGPTQSIK